MSAPSKSKPSNRLLLFCVLGRAGSLNPPQTLSSSEIRKAIRMAPSNGQLGVLLRGEIAAKRLTTSVFEDGIEYRLTAKGKKHLEQGLVDSWAKENGLVSLGRAWEKKTTSVNQSRKTRRGD